MTHPAIIAERGIYALLAPGGMIDPDLVTARVIGVWPDVVPEGVAWSDADGAGYHIVYASETQGIDNEVVGRVRLMQTPRYLIKVIGRTQDIADLAPAAARIDTLLQSSLVTIVSGGTIDAINREAPVRLGPLFGPGGVCTYQLGGLYRLYLRET